MDVGTEGSDWQPCQPDNLVQGLRCPVCLDYFVKPHTLGCGHSFCLRCLRTLARVTRHARNRAPLDRLRFRCPSCRKLTLARPILRRRAAINYALKELVDDWFSSPYSTGSVDSISLRSIASQTDDANGSVADRSQLNIRVPADNGTEENELDIAGEEYREILFHRIDSKLGPNKESEQILEVSHVTANESGLSDENTVTSSSDDSESEPDIVPLLGDLRIIDAADEPRPRFNRWHATSVPGVLRIFFSEICLVFRGIRQSRSRTVLTIFWFIYGGLVVCVSRGFLPWMAFYTVIYFLILYAEMSQPVALGD